MRQEPGWFALEINRRGVNLAHIFRTVSDKPLVLCCEFHPLDAADSVALEKLRKEKRLEQYSCTTLLGADEYQMLQVEAPSVPREELKAAIRWRIKDMLNYHVDDAMVDVLGIPTDKHKHTDSRSHPIYAVAAPNGVIQKRVSLFEEAGIPLSVVDIPEMAQRNIAALCEHEGKGLAMLSFDDASGLLTFTHGGELYLSRRIDVAFGQLSDADNALRERNLERLVLELQRSFDYFDQSWGRRTRRAGDSHITLDKLLLAPLPEETGLQEKLAAKLDVTVEALNLSQIIDCGPAPALKDAAEQARLFYALGAALRHEVKTL
ncbi:MAG TPA: agglutinin biogenesis protein MshI [Burkholderiales bacterium]|nr:agglutinin biogenesis protein MshI [Burkholderiales bacterium]